MCWTLVLLGCAAASPREPEPDPNHSGPVLVRLDPDSGFAGMAYPVRVTITGRGFAASENVVQFGSITLAPRPALEAGTRLEFDVPKTRPATGEVPPFVLAPGRYDVTVRTPAGSSNPLPFRLTRNP